jgi:two-component system chemotaxis response regulator CheY
VKRIDVGLQKKRGGGKTVLVVDDNPGIRQAVCRAFVSDGFAVCGEAANGREALSLAKRLKPDLIILDLSMPVMTGLQAAPELRKIAPKAPIILFTMYSAELRKEDATSMGIDWVASKTEPLSEIIKKAHILMGD